MFKQGHQFPTLPPSTTTLTRWIGFKYNLAYCQMWFMGHFLMVHPLISVLFSLFGVHQITSFSQWEEKCFFFGALWQQQGCYVLSKQAWLQENGGNQRERQTNTVRQPNNSDGQEHTQYHHYTTAERVTHYLGCCCWIQRTSGNWLIRPSAQSSSAATETILRGYWIS